MLGELITVIDSTNRASQVLSARQRITCWVTKEWKTRRDRGSAS